MNKLLIISVVAILVLAMICLMLFLPKRDNDKNDESEQEETTIQIEEDKTTSINWLCVEELTQIEDLIDKTNANVEYRYGSELVFVYDVQFGIGKATYIYDINENDEVTETSVSYKIVDSEAKDGEYVAEDIEFSEFRDRLYGVFNCIDNALGIRIENQYSIFSSDGTVLDSSDEKSLEKVADGEAELELRIRDTDGSIWILSISNEYGYNDILCTFRHYAADSEQAKSYCNMAVGD